MKISYFISFIPLVLLLSSCFTNVKLLESFNDYGLNNKYKYQNIPILRVVDEDKSPLKLNYVVNPEHIKNFNYDKNVVLQVFINQFGKIAQIYIIKSLNSECNKLAIRAIKESSFTTVPYGSNKTNFSFFVSYTFNNEEKIYPVVNGFLSKVGKPEFADLRKAKNIEDLRNTDIKKHIIYKQIPRYPKIAIYAGITGTVVVTVIVDEFGNVVDTAPFKSIPLLLESATEAAYNCRFKPRLNEGKPVKVIMNVPFKYSLK